MVVSATQYSKKDFSRDAIQRFGPLCEELIECAELLHPQMSCLARTCLEQKIHALPILLFLEHILRMPDFDREIENAVAISFIEWPTLQRLKLEGPIPPRVEHVVRHQFETYGCNA